MTGAEWLGALAVLLLLGNGWLLFRIWRQIEDAGLESERIESTLQGEFRAAREESGYTARALREEIGKGQQSTTDTLVTTVGELGRGQQKQLEGVHQRIEALTASNEARIERLRLGLEHDVLALRPAADRLVGEFGASRRRRNTPRIGRRGQNELAQSQ